MIEVNEILFGRLTHLHHDKLHDSYEHVCSLLNLFQLKYSLSINNTNRL